MEKKTEKPTKRTAKKSTKQPSKPTDAKDTLIKLAQVLLPIAGIFTALSYFLGRLHIESYYYSLGITPHVLVFKSEDYMFSSFNLVIMSFLISLYLYMYLRLPLFPVIKEKLLSPLSKDLTFGEALRDTIGISIVFLGFGLGVWNLFANNNYGYATPGFMGLNAGIVIGFGAILYIAFMQWLSRTGKPTGIGLIMTILVIIAFLPSITNRLAEIQVKSDMLHFPAVTIVCESELPTQLQISTSRPEESIEVQLVMTNNGMTYLLKQDNEITDEWEIYAIPEDNIEQIVYLHSGKNES